MNAAFRQVLCDALKFQASLTIASPCSDRMHRAAFDYGLRERMAHAMKLLSRDGVSASGVAKSIGYSNQASFSTAFKKYYDRLPRETRRSSSKFLTP